MVVQNLSLFVSKEGSGPVDVSVADHKTSLWWELYKDPSHKDQDALAEVQVFLWKNKTGRS
jgi:hypothetical protein